MEEEESQPKQEEARDEGGESILDSLSVLELSYKIILIKIVGDK